MVQTLSKLNVADNSGIKEIMIIHVLGRKKGGTHTRFASIGDIVSASAKKVMPDSAFKKGEVVHAVVVRTTKEIRRVDGTYLRFDENAAVIINKETKEPRGTRVFGPVGRELKEKGFQKIVSLAPEVL